MYKIQDSDSTQSLFTLLLGGETSFSFEVLDDHFGASKYKIQKLSLLINAVHNYVFKNPIDDSLLIEVYNVSYSQLEEAFKRSSFKLCSFSVDDVVKFINIALGRY